MDPASHPLGSGPSVPLIESPRRPTGIGVVGDITWGSHFFLFYETKEDLLETLVPYFKAGLESGEFCVWALCKPLTAAEAMRALRRSVADIDRYLSNRS